MDLLNIYLRHETLILIPVLYFIGILLSQTPMIPTWVHSWIKVAFAIIACLLYFGFDIRSVVQGILVTGAELILRDLLHNTLFGIQEKRLARTDKKDTAK
ncbi:holin [Oceanobacillus arenosus]|uniref:Holin n=1 Tax=Oceanobacillus arenosus TaxID=1229153 RepID=A0A3D8PJK6_9BACI|nr:phage holin family protein [Oceanobacillus arenosus]RDW15842.1 holin [Oceanobacillus arenosus]